MKNIKLIISAISLSLLTSCDPSDFGDINVDPNNPSTAIVSFLLTGAERGLVGPITDVEGSLYTQQIANKQYTGADRYETINFSFNGYYAGPLVNLNKIIQLNTDETTKGGVQQYGSNNNQIAIARILKAYFFAHITDRWGDIPYSEALQGNTDFTPKFDSQDAIYAALFKELKEASTQIDGGLAVQGDFLLNGNMTKWKKFANSLRAILALRLSKVDPAKGKTEFASALADGLILTNADNVVYNFKAEDANDSPWEDRFETRLDWTVSKPMVDKLKEFADPRLPIFADKALLVQDYVGMPYGLAQADAGGIPNGQVSFLGAAMRKQTSPSFIITAAQVHLAIAEAATLGWVAEDAKAHYETGITASIEQWGATGAPAYLAGAAVKFDASKAITQIATQRWIALFTNGYEAWAEWRRTGIPALSPPPVNSNPGGKIPRRQAYPTSERDLNGDNYKAALSSKLGGVDDLNGKVWWDK